MSTYVFSDVHGHLAPLDRLLERIAPGEGDSLFMLGDMIDRGPDPVGVMRCCRDLPGCTVLMGNHEDLLLSCLEQSDDPIRQYNWQTNGAASTQAGLDGLDEASRTELLGWVEQLPVCAITQVGERPYILVHAGIRADGLSPRESWDAQALLDLLDRQLVDDLLWIREDFWGRPTNLLDEAGRGPIVIAGHTPTAYLDGMADLPERPSRADDGLCQMVRVGACEATGGVSDRWDIDCGAAGGAGFGKVCMLRLDDGMEFYEPVREGE